MESRYKVQLQVNEETAAQCADGGGIDRAAAGNRAPANHGSVHIWRHFAVLTIITGVSHI